MPWTTPTLAEVRALNRDAIASRLVSGPPTPNSVLRVMSDANAGLAHLNFNYIDWLSLQLLPDKAETEWLGRWGGIWLGGRKQSTFATGTATFTGTPGTVLPTGSRVRNTVDSVLIEYETTADVTVSASPSEVAMRAIDPGVIGNLDQDTQLSLSVAVTGVDAIGVIVSMTGGVDEEGDDDLRVRVLERIREPPMGGAAHDYVQWATAIPGVTRAWCSPMEMGIGTVTVRFMMDELRATANGFPNVDDVAEVQAYIDARRPVTALDCFVVAPIAEPVSFTLDDLDSDDASTLLNIEASCKLMLRTRAAPAFAQDGIAQDAQTIYASWISEAVSRASGVRHFHLTMTDHVMPSPGHLAVLGNIVIS